ncbi:hypothetical protein RhiirC2_707888 [Rhizophagus irregularis]|uniref:Uncharacterized protein n=1 Tax=Rhizophagus irregularis TaxID=588596 RepID=A0A2N1NPG2_9GLOM|nr:hypothetical protein RhiirC2_707888 [Rhizophagus irregularis]
MEIDWEFFINFHKDIEEVFMPFFTESFESLNVENAKVAKSAEIIIGELEDIIMSSNNSFIGLGIELIEPFINNTNTSNTNTFSCSTYQYNLCIEDNFDDWEFVDKFINAYCLERGFGYQIYRNDKDLNNHIITRRKSFHCSLDGNYKTRKTINQNLWAAIRIAELWATNRNSTPKSAILQNLKIICEPILTTLVDLHNHELNPTQIAHLNARYRQFNENMIQDLSFFTGCNVAPITQLEILKKKYPQHVFHKQDVYNAIYSLIKNIKDEDFDSGLLLNSLFEKMTEDLN